MSVDVIVGLITNIILLMSLSVVYSLFTNETKSSRLSSKLVMGISISIVGFIIMAEAVEVEPGIMFDGRTILMLLSGIFFGVIPVAISGVILSLNRIMIGGSGVVPGVLWVIIPGIIGLVWRYFRIKKDRIDLAKISILEQYLILLFTQVLVVGILFLFPNKVSINAINAVAIPLIIAYPIGGLAVSLFMMKQRMTYFNALVVKDRAEEYNDLFNKGSHYSFLINPQNGNIMNVNQVAIDRYGYTIDEFHEMTIYDLNLLSKEETILRQNLSTKDNMNYYIVKHIMKNKDIIDVEVRSVPITIDGTLYSYATVSDITDRLIGEKKYEDVNVKLKATLHSVSEGIISTNEYGEIEIINEIAKSYLYTSKNLIGNKLTDIIRVYSKDNKLTFKEIYEQVISSRKSFKAQEPFLLINNEDDSTLYIDFSLSSIIYSNNELKGTILVFRDVTEQYEQSNQIQYISQHDYLTGLYNRYFLEVEMKRLDTVRQLPISIIHGDVNGLKLTNDAFGHIEGDNLLKEISLILKKATRSEDIISRWGGDEFIILLPQTTSKNALKVLDRIRDLQNKSMYDIMTPSISLGLSTKTREDQDLNKVLAEAETEMYSKKQKDGKTMRNELLNRLEKRLYSIHPELGSHGYQVGKMAKEFGEFLELDYEDSNNLTSLGIYHDIGWINIDERILLNAKELTEQDMEILQSHAEVGFRILKSVPELSNIAELVLNHHEMWDGNGYPHGVKGKMIPYLSRILTIIDSYDMMINNSVYSPKKSIDDAIAELRLFSGKQFDPKLTEKFIQYIKK
jgi:diguanylate cyclase (GGDEF)-like protein/PAS domain S-box-containing protein